MSPKANGFPDSGPFAQGSAIGSDEPGSSSSNVIYPSSFTGGASANVTTPIPPSAGYAEAPSGVGNTSQGDIMTDPIREEIDAKLTIVELRTENRFNELSSKIDRVVDSITALNSTMASELGSVKSELMIVKADNKYTRWTIILAVLAALGALWVTQSNLLSVLHFKLGCC
jgi:hypothetical protein